MAGNRTFPAELRQWNEYIEERAREVGLDFYPVRFEVVDPVEINEIAALGGFPQRYPHWRFGMEYEKLSKSYTYGLSKIYELVINTDPVYAYLLSTNGLTDQKLVMAHVYGHADFFKHNSFFKQTNRRMLDQMANSAVKVRGFQERYGVDVVEEFIDACLSLDNMIDLHGVLVKPVSTQSQSQLDTNKEKEVSPESLVPKMRSYLEKFSKRDEPSVKPKDEDSEPQVKLTKIPEKPERDVLKFILDHAPLKDWQKEIVSIIREEAYYFAPQGQTKIMNEGWASYWHTKLLTQHHILNDTEVVHYADVHSGTMYTPKGGFNPYKIGLELFRDIEDRWNKGRFGKEWEECEDLREKEHWDRNTGLGRQKIFEVRKLYSDVTFIDTFLTEDFCRRLKLFTFGYSGKNQRTEIESTEFQKVKSQLLAQLTNFGQPIIEIEDANYGNRGELLLRHRFDGRELKSDWANLTMKNLTKLWGRPVHLATLLENKEQILSVESTSSR